MAYRVNAQKIVFQNSLHETKEDALATAEGLIDEGYLVAIDFFDAILEPPVTGDIPDSD